MKTGQKNLTAGEVFENRRKFPRLRMNLPVVIIGPDSSKIKGLLHDISPDGARVSLSSTTWINAVTEMESPVEKVKSMKCILLFDLAYDKNICHIRLGVYPVYLNRINDETTIAGMLFSEDDLTENKKVSEFLFYQLALSFIESGYQPENKTERKPVKKTKDRTKIISNLSVQKDTGRNIPAELNELILNIEHSKTDLEPLKVLLFRIMNSLHAIHETTRHIDERIRTLEHKISRKD